MPAASFVTQEASMRNLLHFIIRYHFFFLFLVLFVVAMILTGSRQHYQQALMWHSANQVAARFYQSVHSVTSYLALRKEKAMLQEQNNRLLNKMIENFIIREDTVFEVSDSSMQRRFTYMEAGVINRSVTRRNNYLTLDKGKKHGVQPNMGVITAHGVAGVIKAVSDNFSLAISLLHSDVLVSVKLKKNDHMGSLQWEGVDYRVAHMYYIPPHVDLTPGDKVVTSGLSTIFPAHIPIGRVKDWEIRLGETFYTAVVDLELDFNKLTHVHIVKNLLQEEQEELEMMMSPDI